MPRKAFLVQVELHIQAVTCPGVWLCPNGKISLQMHMLGSCIQTRCADPTFPVLIDEKFVFSRSYHDVGRLGNLQRVFNKDLLYVELIQWQNCENGNVLATFQTTLAELLYPESRKQSLGSAEVDLLMEPMKNFPGILAPKVEVATKTIIQDEVCPTSEEDLAAKAQCNPNLISSSSLQRPLLQCGHEIMRQKPVCHTKRNPPCCSGKCPALSQPAGSVGAARRPPFVVRKVPADLKYYCGCKDCNDERCKERALAAVPSKMSSSRVIQARNSSVRRVPSDANALCFKRLDGSRRESPTRWSPDVVCERSEQHTVNCLVCAKYKHYFEERSIKSHKRPENDTLDCPCQHADTQADDAVLCNYPPSSQQLQKQPSMAQRLHGRLSETLSQCVACENLQQSVFNNNCDCGDCICDDVQDCAAGTLSQFYKKLYACGNKRP